MPFTPMETLERLHGLRMLGQVAGSELLNDKSVVERLRAASPVPVFDDSALPGFLRGAAHESGGAASFHNLKKLIPNAPLDNFIGIADEYNYSPGILAHEIGHTTFDKSNWLGRLMSPTKVYNYSDTAQNLAPIGAMMAGAALPSRTSRALGVGLATLATVPRIIPEWGAWHAAKKHMTDAGANAQQMDHMKGVRSRALNTVYDAPIAAVTHGLIGMGMREIYDWHARKKKEREEAAGKMKLGSAAFEYAWNLSETPAHVYGWNLAEAPAHSYGMKLASNENGLLSRLLAQAGKNPGVSDERLKDFAKRRQADYSRVFDIPSGGDMALEGRLNRLETNHGRLRDETRFVRQYGGDRVGKLPVADDTNTKQLAVMLGVPLAAAGAYAGYRYLKNRQKDERVEPTTKQPRPVTAV